MKPIFVDTSFWIARLHKKDDLHDRAVAIENKLANMPLITSELILNEVLNEFSKSGRHFRKLAANLVHTLRARDNVKIIPLTSV